MKNETLEKCREAFESIVEAYHCAPDDEKLMESLAVAGHQIQSCIEKLAEDEET